MIQHIKVLKQSLQDKELYLWDIGKAAMWTFFAMAARGLDIKGFLTNYPEYCGETIMNRPVISPEQLRQKENALIITSEEVTPSTFELVQSFGDVCSWPEALEFNPILKEEPVFLCGTGEEAWRFIKQADQNDISIRGILTEDQTGLILSVPMMLINETRFAETDRIVLMRDYAREDNEIAARLQQEGFGGTVFIRELTRRVDLWSCDPYVLLDAAMKEDKRILFCCEDDMSRQLFREIFDRYHVPIAREVTYSGDEAHANDIWSLADEDVSNSVLLIHSLSALRRLEIVEAANDLGYSAGGHSLAATDIACYNRDLCTGVLAYEADDKLTTSIDFSDVGGLPGWKRYGEEGTRIMILGGSTSSEVYYEESWASKLYHKILTEGKQAVIYNGAHESNGVYEELNRMVRSIRTIKPDIVISLSGYNDMAQPDCKFSLAYRETSFQYWRQYESYMKAVAEAEGAVFYAILQPINQDDAGASLQEAMMYLDQVHKRAPGFPREPDKEDFYYNIFTKFFHRDDMFIDLCHYSDKGNEEIAEYVYNLIKEHLK